MGRRSFSDLSLAWIWIIEYLASRREIDPAVLVDLVNDAPELPDDLGRSVREIVALRSLEALVDGKMSRDATSNGVTSRVGTSAQLDLNESCEHALQSVLHMASLSDLKTGRIGLLSYEINTFAAHKRASLPKCSLEKLKDAIVDGTHPNIDSIRELSCLYPRGDKTHVVDHYGGPRIIVDSPIPQTECFNHQRIEEVPGSIREEETCVKVLSTSKRKRADSFSEDHEVEDTLLHRNSKMIRSDPDINIEFPKGSPLATKQKQVEDSFDNQNGQYMHAKKDDHVGPSASVGLVEDQDISLDHVEGENSKRNQTSHLNLPEYDGSKNIDTGGAACGTSGAWEDSLGGMGVHECEAMRKSFLLSSQCASLSEIDCTEQNICLKCSKGGELLYCNDHACSVAVHGNCLSSAPKFDQSGNFYCPRCTYSRAVSKLFSARKKLSMAEKDLEAFLQNILATQTARPCKELETGDHDGAEPGRHEAFQTCVENGIRDEKESACPLTEHPCGTSAQNGEMQEDSFAPCISLDTPDGVSPLEIREPVCASDEEKEGEEGNPEFPIEEETGDRSIRENMMEVHDDTIQKGTPEMLSGESINSVKVGDTKKVDHESGHLYSSYALRIRRTERQYVSPPVPHLRRKTLLWTRKEEETLKKGVQKFSKSDEPNIPWKTILEFGSAVWKGRTQVDLKDKWRNMCRGSPRYS